jgi:lysophospholipase L1-like esterase
MPGKRISELTALSGAGSANNDDVIIFDTTASETKRISRSQLAEGMTPDLPLQYYLGVLNSNPTQRLNGDALMLGDYYLDAVTKYTTIYNGSGWNSYASVIAVQTASEAARDKAQEWATNPENDPVETGQYSALHWSAKAEDEKLAAQAARTAAETAETNAELAETNAETARDAAIVAKTAAELAETNAETARDAAFVNANVYADTAAGLAAVALNGQFQVVSGTEVIRYREDAGPVATEVARYPSANAVHTVANEVARIEELAGFIDPLPQVTVGSSTPDSANFSVGSIIANGDLLPSNSLLQSVSFRLSGSGSGEIHVYKRLTATTWECTHAIGVTLTAGGVHTFSAADGTLPVGITIPEGGFVAYRMISGSLRYSSGGTGSWHVISGFTGVGSTVTRGGSLGTQEPALGFTVETLPASLDSRLTEVEQSIGTVDDVVLQVGYAPDADVSEVTLGDTSGDTAALAAAVFAPVAIMPEAGRIKSVTVRLGAAGTYELHAFKRLTDSTWECVAVWAGTTTQATGLLTITAGDGVIPKNFFLEEGGFVAFKSIGARMRYGSGAGGWIEVINATGVGAFATRTLNTNGYIISISFTYEKVVASIDKRLTALESGIAGWIEQAVVRVGLNYGLLPRISSTKAYALGDSTVAAYAGGTAIMGLITSNRVEVDLSVPGHTIAQQKSAWIAQTIDPALVGWVVVQIGLNDLDPADGTTASKIAALQDLVSTIRSEVGTKPIFISKMIPCKQRLINLYGAVNGAVSQQRWVDMNAAIAGTGSSPITGVDGRITAHVPLLDDGSGNLKLLYDTGDAIHPNTAGRQINATAWVDALRAAGLVI